MDIDEIREKAIEEAARDRHWGLYRYERHTSPPR
jgi:hypothetical protein